VLFPLPGPAEADDGLFGRAKVAVHLVLAAQGHGFLLDQVPVQAVPDRPPDVSRQHVRVELHPYLDVLQPPHDGPAKFPFLRIVQVPGVAVGRRVLDAARLARRQLPGKRDHCGVDVVADLVQLAGDVAAPLPDLQRQGVGVVQVGDAVKAIGGRLDDLKGAGPGDPAIRPDVDVIVQGQGLVPGRAERRAQVFLDPDPHGPLAGQDADPPRTLPQPPQPAGVRIGDPERVDEQREGWTAEQRPRQRPADGVLELARQHVLVAGHPRVAPQMMGEHLGDGELVDIPGPRAQHVLLPSLPVRALLSQ
jgi:hypothetical protein